MSRAMATPPSAITIAIRHALLARAVDGVVPRGTYAAVAVAVGATNSNVRWCAHQLGLTTGAVPRVTRERLDTAIAARSRLGRLPLGATKTIAAELGLTRDTVRYRAGQLLRGDPIAAGEDLIG